MTIKTDNIQVGVSTDPTKNFVLRQPSTPDGSLILSRGNAEAPGATILTVNPQGAILLPDGTYVGCNGRRNKLRNGNGRVNQRGNTQLTTDGNFVLDGWVTQINIAGSTCTVGNNSANNPSVTGGTSVFVQNGATVKAVLAAADYLGTAQRIEGLDIADLLWGTASAKPITISFRAWASQATTIAVVIRNSAATRAYVAPVALSAGAGYYSATILGCTDGAWSTDTSLGLVVSFMGSVGSTYVAPSANVWASGNFLGAPGMSNICDTANRYFVIGDVQLEAGTASTSYEWRDYGDELRRCQRYFQRFPADYVLFSGNVTSGIAYYVTTPLLAPMRASGVISNVASASANGMGAVSANFKTNSILFSSNATSTTNGAYFYAGCDVSAEL